MAPVQPIAIIGTGCRFPGSASSPSRLWELLREPRDVASKPPADRFNPDAFYQAGKPRPGVTNAPESYFLDEDVRAFDAAFFNISSMEAASMDPQQRLLLEVVYESLERAGLPLQRLQGSSTGVYCGSMNHDYAELVYADLDAFPTFGVTGTSNSMLATRVSYFFDWQGPSIVLDTACSSSLTAVHLAVDALRKEDCTLAVATGSFLILSPDTYVRGSQLHMLSSKGRCHMWDEAADGYARGEGVASIILKRLSDALRDGDDIQGVIRATGTNCDGSSQSLTMPNAEAQSNLIRSTYARAGLNPLLQEDRCQYFEAHGTGTVAGDWNEAAGIHNALFNQDSPADEIIHVGSVKTVLGHSEACAGLSGLLKALLAVQHGVIPPNLLLNKISPQVAPYTSHLRVPTKLIPWPDLPAGTPRRASVSSFGFGGANAHVILESFSGSDSPPTSSETAVAEVLPFVFSAMSEKSLKEVLQQYVDVLEEHPAVDLLDLAFSLLTRRSALSHRIILTADSVYSLKEKLEEELDKRTAPNASSTITTRVSRGPKRILGIFTGQGAQWAQMGLDLISQCPQARAWLQELQDSLDGLPTSYRPTFTLLDELAAPESNSRLSSAAVSLPLRTALQIIQINILQSLGVEFAAVVGHSSGEIAAAYAAGWLTASDAIRIAYLRGVSAKHAGSKGQPGSMLAVNISWEQAEAICSEDPYKGSVVVAASNSPTNVTLSGDSEMISELEWLFESLDHSPRRLHVDTAYHSHHMIPCIEPYLQAMTACQTGARQGSRKAKWFSSVQNGNVMTELDNEYWCKNMLQSVRFSEAMAAALESEPDLDAFVEIGPHPALRGPSLQTLSTLKPKATDMPYIPLAMRGFGGVESLALAVGLFWAHLGAASINIPSFVGLFCPSRQPKYLSWLPTYPFDHSHTFWAVPRLSTARISRRLPRHPLLGGISPETGEGEWRWRNFLRVDDLPWVECHQAQSQIILPATAYLVMALEAAHLIADGRVLQLVEITDLAISRALPIPDDAAGIEIMFTAYQTNGSNDSNLIISFTCQATFKGTLRRCASGRIAVTFGKQDATLLPRMGPTAPGLRAIDSEQFYTQLDMLGLGYSGPFRGLTELHRRKDIAYGTIAASHWGNDPLLVHPAMLDMSLQALMVAMGSPGDGQVSSLYLPIRLERVTVNPAFCKTGALHASDGHLTVEAKLTKIAKTGVSGDIDVFDAEGRGFVQVEGMQLSQLAQPTGDDCPIFAGVVWGPLAPKASSTNFPTTRFGPLADRIALLYLRDTQIHLTSKDRQHLDWHRGLYVAWMDRVLAAIRDGTHQRYSADCLEGDIASVLTPAAEEVHPVELRTLETTAKHLIGWLRGQSLLAEELGRDNLLSRVCQEAHNFGTLTQHLATLVGQLAFRYPRMKILEVGAGRSSATQMVLDHLGRDYHSYTYTDLSEDSFDKARERFVTHNDRFFYRELDIERDPIEQGFSEHEYDLVIASNVLCGTHSLKQTLAHVRRLLKPGGRVAVSEATDPENVAASFILGGSEEWWLGESGGRLWGPQVSRKSWNEALHASGFGGFEAISPTEEESKLLGLSVFISRAVDERVQRLIEPFSVPANGQFRDLVLLGGATTATAKLLSAVRDLVGPFFRRITAAKRLEDCVPPPDASLAVVLAASDIDSPCLKGLTADRLHGLQNMISVTGRLLWLATGRLDENLYLRMSKGLLRSLAFENPHAGLQHLTISDPGEVSPDLVASVLMRLVHAEVGGDHRLSRCMESTEWELMLEDGILKIPRMHSNTDMNQRWLASRGISKSRSVDPEQSCVEVCTGDNTLTFSPSFAERQPDMNGLRYCKEMVRIRVQYATLPAVRIDSGFLHLVLGVNEATGTRVLALSASHASVVSTYASWCLGVPSWTADREDSVFLDDVCAALVAQHLVRHAPAGSTLLLHGASQSLREAVSAVASRSSVQVCTITTDGKDGKDPATLAIPPRSPSHTISRLLPANVSLLATFAPDTDRTISKIQPCLPPGSTSCGLKDFYGTTSFPPAAAHHSVADSLTKACLFPQDHKSPRSVTEKISPQDVPGLSLGRQKLKIVDWMHSGPVEADPLPASSLVGLSADKTYLLVGMTGDVGQSVCQWMIARGARSVVLTSRSPKVDPRWLGEMSGLGARVVVMAMDVADRASVLRVHERIQLELPSVGGILNGAMVLRDGPFANLSLEDVLQVFAPKIEGSLILDELYRDTDLDFFLLMGSMSGPVGNFHQSAYAAATEFMAALVHQRRLRGQVGSIIHPAQIRGVGYLANMDPQLTGALTDRMGPLILSERDLLELVAEGILAGRLDSGQPVEIVGGYRMTDPAEYPNVQWYSNPMQWPFIQHFPQSEAAGPKNKEVPMKTQLLAADSLNAAAEIIAHGFSEKLRQRLQLPSDAMLLGTTLVMELGVDSLVAVDLRSWFLKELGVDMPVLQLLGGSSINDLASNAADKLEPIAVPLVKAEQLPN
ncbi:hypothetical protein EYZ11_005806 [Aspergillus tanneri]|uniref:Type I Polyketide synthases (Type I PKS) n=1 Tax=Aspergillus tanneri TaxID=1220188 RepID=A0A4S3JH22_9EURO|nr:Type I Polyketide synthases (Type I PKS) [Aspergillus tanneri]KAA8649567.1 Type I Polyketide synthases (Type I PKS) [Aspergillus tanneri]THC94726.1 hypothetical protein EYZ11_005806 [Aspergillus tanneri]